MSGTFSQPPWVSDPDMHRGTCVTHVPWCMPGSLPSGFLWSRSRGNRSRYSRRMRKSLFYASGKRPMTSVCFGDGQKYTYQWKNCRIWITKSTRDYWYKIKRSKPIWCVYFVWYDVYGALGSIGVAVLNFGNTTLRASNAKLVSARRNSALTGSHENSQTGMFNRF